MTTENTVNIGISVIVIGVLAFLVFNCIWGFYPHYRIVEKSDGLFYIQRRFLLFFYEDDLNCWYSTYDGYTQTKSFKSLNDAQEFAKANYHREKEPSQDKIKNVYDMEV